MREEGYHVLTLSLGPTDLEIPASRPQYYFLGVRAHVALASETVLQSKASMAWNHVKNSGPRSHEPERCLASKSASCSQELCGSEEAEVEVSSSSRFPQHIQWAQVRGAAPELCTRHAPVALVSLRRQVTFSCTWAVGRLEY